MTPDGLADESVDGSTGSDIELFATIGPTTTQVALGSFAVPAVAAPAVAAPAVAATADGPGGGPPSISIPWGPVNLDRRWLCDGDPPAPDALTNALGAIDDYLADADRIWNLPAPRVVRTVKMTGNTVAAIARFETGIDRPPAAHEVQRADLEEIFRIAATEPGAELAENPGLRPGDANGLVAGLCIAASIARRYRVPSIWLIEPNPPTGSGSPTETVLK